MNEEFRQITESFDNWCKTLIDEENISRFDSFVAYKKFACACLTFYDVDIDRRDEARRELDRLLAGGVRSIGWDFSPNIERAEKDGYPDMDELREYARKITTE